MKSVYTLAFFNPGNEEYQSSMELHYHTDRNEAITRLGELICSNAICDGKPGYAPIWEYTIMVNGRMYHSSAGNHEESEEENVPSKDSKDADELYQHAMTDAAAFYRLHLAGQWDIDQANKPSKPGPGRRK